MVNRIAIVSLVVVSVVGPAWGEANPLRYLPSDTRVVVTVHPARLDSRERDQGTVTLRRVFTSLVAPHFAADEKLAVADLTRVVVGLPYAGSVNGVFVLQGKIDAARFERQMQAAVRAGDVTVEPMGKPPVNVYRRVLDPDRLGALIPPLSKVPPAFRKLVAPSEVYLAVVDDQTLFASMAGRTAVERALRARPPASRPRTSSELTALLAKQDPTDVAIITVMDSSLHPGLHLIANESTREAFDQFEHVVTRFRGGKEVTFHIDVAGKTADVGPALEEKAKGALANLRTLLPKVVPSEPHQKILAAALRLVRVERTDGHLTLTGALPADDVRRLLTPPAEAKKDE
ncbi:MAG: hypothetical protein U0736_27705 [Gemmataceae bacterium]